MLLLHRRSVDSVRLLRFGIVGAGCGALQLAGVYALIQAGLYATVSFALCFVASAQLNFLLSWRFTWADRRLEESNGRRLRRWAGYNLTALAGLLVSTVTFAEGSRVAGLLIGALCGIAASTSITFLVGDRLLFSGKGVGTLARRNRVSPIELASDSASPLSATSGITFFLPAYNEADNLPLVVERALASLAGFHIPHQVVVVDDGSTDETAQVVDALGRKHGERISGVRHTVNLGYGTALQSGFRKGLENGHDWIAFVDADAQFDPRQLDRFVAAARESSAALVVGYRISRADNWVRCMNGRLWHWLSHLLLGISVRDVDCGFKLVNHRVLKSISLTGTYATVSPELLAKATWAGFHVVEVPVDHYPRMAGTQTGANLRVILGSLVSLLRLRTSLSLGREERRTRSATASAPRGASH
jgi:putative flippase GtrA